LQVQPTNLPALERKTSLRTLRVLTALAAVSAATGAGSAAAQAPRDPTQPCPGATNPLPGETCGDNYLESVRITTHSIKGGLQAFSDSVDTSKATTQTDLFKPGGNRVGPPEQTAVNGNLYGKTVWYDLNSSVDDDNPSVDGDVLVQAVGAGFNPVICLLPYDVGDGPNFRPIGAYSCSNQGAGPLEQLQRKGIRRGRGYSVQVGGVGGTGGPVELDVNFTPYRVSATPKLAFQLTPQGVKLLNVLVKSSRKSRVEVSCKGCGKRVKRGRRVSLNFRKALRAGSKLTIRVTRKGEIGAYFSYKIRKGRRPVETQRCLNPGSKKPRKRCP